MPAGHPFWQGGSRLALHTGQSLCSMWFSHCSRSLSRLKASIWARGRGTIGLTLYTYGKVRRQMRSIPYGPGERSGVTGEWRQYETRLRVTDRRVSEVRLAVNHWPGQTGGEFYYDDAHLTVGGW